LVEHAYTKIHEQKKQTRCLKTYDNAIHVSAQYVIK